MHTINRVMYQLTPGRVFLGLALLVTIPLLAAVHPAVAGIGFAVSVSGWVIWMTRSSHRSWPPDVRAENAYQILGVAQSADTPAIRRAFRELERQYHPDAVPADRKAEATAVFIRLNQAYELLTNSEMRYEYDYQIAESGGVIPPFEETFQRLKDIEKHPLYAEYDARYGRCRDAGPGEWDAAGRHPDGPSQHHSADGEGDRLSTPSRDGTPTIPTETAPAADPTGPPVEVEVPEAIREAMGLTSRETTSPRQDRGEG